MISKKGITRLILTAQDTMYFHNLYKIVFYKNVTFETWLLDICSITEILIKCNQIEYNRSSVTVC